VPSLREWLTRKQKETRKGRAELLLADRAAVWNARPENRQLPSLLQWLTIRWHTAKAKWTPPQRKMMGKAARVHATRAGMLAVFLVACGLAGFAIREQVRENRNAEYAAGLAQRILDADTAQVPAVVAELPEYRRWADPRLRAAFDAPDATPRQKLHASLALLPVEPDRRDYLLIRLLDAEAHEVPVIRDALVPHQDALSERLWAAAEKPEKGKEPQRLRAAAALAKYDAESEKWDKAGAAVVDDLVRENPVFLGQWSEAFRPVRGRLLSRLSAISRDRQPDRTAERSLATNLLVDYAGDQPAVLADLLMDADEKQFGAVFPPLRERPIQALPLLLAEMDKKLPDDVPSSDDKRDTLAKRQAAAAVALLRLGQPEKVWPLLKHSPDPRVRSYFIHRLFPLGADPEAIVRRLDEEPDLSARRALLLALGEFDEATLPAASRNTLLPKVQQLYRDDPDPGLHAAAEWLLRTWKQEAWLKQVNDEWVKDKEQREKRLAGIGKVLAKAKDKAPPQWYVNSQGQTFVVIPGPVQFLLGSPTTEADRQTDEVQHQRKIGRSFALAATPVTKEQFLRFLPKFSHSEFRRYPEDTCPVGGVTWFEAARYCNWLSNEEGIPKEQWCYEIKGNEVKLRANYLSLTGYRLPTEAEMEYATRAGAVTSRYFGETDELLPRYAWYFKNSQERTWPVGSLKPNDLGLFDAQGNVFTWCQESYQPYPKDAEVSEDGEDELMVISTRSRVLRGGSFGRQASEVRSAVRYFHVPALRNYGVGFRPARTLPLDGFTALPLSPEGARK
jgi:formylglycine-generating enzyme required for sulfatase activity